jgi:hypothetical protein
MPSQHSLDILFLTNFSDYCFRAIPAVAELADRLSVRLTLMHVFDPAAKSQALADRQIASFFPEADRFRSCRRLAAAGALLPSVLRHLEYWPVNLIVAPASGPLGLPRLGRLSARARLVEKAGVPLFTIGRRVQVSRLNAPVSRVACWIDFDSYQTSHVPYAVEYARKLGAELHLLQVLPEIHDGFVASDRSIHPDAATEELRRLCVNASIQPRIHVASGGGGRSSLVRLIEHCNADVVFLGHQQSPLQKWIGYSLPLGDALPCPAVYFGSALKVPTWNLAPRPTTCPTPEILEMPTLQLV